MRLAAVCLALVCSPAAAQSTATWRAFGLPSPPLDARNVGLVVNEDDPYSVEVGEHYRRRRGIPEEHVLRVRLPDGPTLDPARFEALRAAAQRLPEAVQVLALAWVRPYAVGCASITGALALGTQPQLCEHSCAATPASPWFDSPSRRPRTDFGLLPAMLLAAPDIAQARALIDRGVAADRSRPRASAYFLSTSDAARNVRASLYPRPAQLTSPFVEIKVLQRDVLEGARDVLIYLTGQARVQGLDSLRFVPGALADHLTSFGGRLENGSSQMSILSWIAAGATASYGTVSEPCNHPQKFPHPAALLRHYLAGETAIEAYWKSVAWPLQGAFVGEPLAAPFR